MQSAVGRYRLRARLTQEQLAAKVGLHATVLSKIENGHRPLKAEEFVRLARALTRSPEDFLPAAEAPQGAKI